MKSVSYKTKSLRKEDTDPQWFVVDAEGEVLGRLASKIAHVLRGKHKPEFTPHVDCGDHVIVVNAGKVRLTGAKMDDKYYLTYSGYPGGQKKTFARELAAKKPHALIENAVRGMLPKNRLGRAMFRKLFVYTESTHPHGAQKPEPFKF